MGFSTAGNLKIHNLTHTQEKPVECNVCHKTFKSKIHLKSHQAVHSEKAFQCDLCTFKSNFREGLKKHVKSVHTGERSHTCNTCGKAYVNQGDLTRHERTHTGEKPFKCDQCGNAYYQKTHLNRHLEQSHGKSGTTVFACEVCDQKYKLKESMQRHMRQTHT